jgi:hypothetical protein
MMITTLISQNLHEVLNLIYGIFSSDCPDQIEIDTMFHAQSYVCEFPTAVHQIAGRYEIASPQGRPQHESEVTRNRQE